MRYTHIPPKTTAAVALATLLGTPACHADTPPVPAPCPYTETDIANPAIAGQPFQNPEEIRSSNGVLTAKLNVVYTDPATTKIAGCGVKLRSYNGKLVGPTLRIKAGDTLNITLNNQLGKAKEDMTLKNVCDNPHNSFGGSPLPTNFNCTNLHTHGLHVSPKDSADNVLALVPPIPASATDKDSPGANPRQISIPLPKSHMPGTEWYHPHVHGSTGIQVASGMEGAVIVEDDPQTTPKSILDASKDEKIFMIQDIPYDDQGQIDDFLSLGDDRSYVRDRYLMVNGQIAPVITMQPGQVQRWRFIDSSFHRTVQLLLQDHDLNEIAVDGNYLSKMDTWVNNASRKNPCCTGKNDQEYTFKLKKQPVELIPGSRSDILVQASTTPGRYKLTATTFLSGRLDPSTATINEYVLAWLEVVKGPEVAMALPTADEIKKLPHYQNIEYKDLTNENSYHQIATFNRDQPAGGNDGGIACNPVRDQTPCYPVAFQVNGQTFHMDNSPRILKLGNIDSWLVTSEDSMRNHVFHIHTNDFQTTRSDPNSETEILWRDSLLVKYSQPQTIYTRYEDFDGTAVMHCHLLSHEDMGMMQAIQFKKQLPTATAGHH